MSIQFTATQVVNERPRPRVLLLADGSSRSMSWVESRSETYREISDLSEVDLEEWDLLVIGRQLDFQELQPIRRSGVYTFKVMDLARTMNHVLDVNVRDGKSAVQLRWRLGIAGHRARRVDNLPEPLQDLVQSSLLPAIERRENQEGILPPPPPADLAPGITEFRPFLVGPGDLVFAASYRGGSGSRHWVVPSDVDDLGVWLDCALNEWHRDQPTVFPTGSAWQVTREWMTADELVVQTRADENLAELNARIEELSNAKAAIDKALTDLRTETDGGTRRLLTSQDDDLQDAVLAALTDLGFDVEDMDQVWEPRARREDFRIRVSDDSTWMVLGDATGTTKGAKLSKLSALQSHLVKYVIEERPPVEPRLWLLVNHLLHRNPTTRGPLFTEGDERVLKEANALAIDTAALFVLVRACQGSDERARAARDWLRSSVGQITLAIAEAWISTAFTGDVP